MRAALGILASLILLTAAPAFAQEAPGGEAIASWFWIIWFAIFVPYFMYWAVATQTIARKTSTPNSWLAWIPFANIFLWANIARKPVWWAILCLVPLVNFVFVILIWMAIADARSKPKWWGILTIVPVVNLLAVGYLAWSE
jgi:hypothetical protein